MSVRVLTVVSTALASNPLGDPHVRALPVIVPDDLREGERVPCVWFLAGYAGLGARMLSHDPWEEGLQERLIRLRREGRIGKMLVALPDAFTRWGGSQYISSGAHGDYGKYLAEELPASVEACFDVSGHGVVGKSSGGYGALVLGMRHPSRFRAVACHSGDMGFRLAYTPDIPALMNAVAKHGSLEAFARAFDAAAKKKDGRWFAPISVLAMCAAYSPDPTQPLGVALPFSLERGEIDERVFIRWLEHDPVVLVDRSDVQASLRKLALLFVDCGSRDEHHLQWGARAFARKLRTYGIAHTHEEFDDGHRSTSYRLDESLPKLFAALNS